MVTKQDKSCKWKSHQRLIVYLYSLWEATQMPNVYVVMLGAESLPIDYDSDDEIYDIRNR